MDNKEVMDMREYLKKYVNVYSFACLKSGLPCNEESLNETIGNAEIEFTYNEKSTGTFAVTTKSIGINKYNYDKNGQARNEFLLLHEFTHLCSGINKELYTDQMKFYEGLCERAKSVDGEYIDGYTAYFGIAALDEVLAQWTCEELNDTLRGVKRESEIYKKGPLGSKITFGTSFTGSGIYDIYSPLEEISINFLKSIGYKDMKDFATKILSSDKGIGELSDESFKKLCYLGVVCRAIYEEEKFVNSETMTKEDVEKAYSLLSELTPSSNGLNI